MGQEVQADSRGPCTPGQALSPWLSLLPWRGALWDLRGSSWESEEGVWGAQGCIALRCEERVAAEFPSGSWRVLEGWGRDHQLLGFLLCAFLFLFLPFLSVYALSPAAIIFSCLSTLLK